MVNYFDLMGMPIDFNIDKNQLDTTFRQLQSHYHPDIAKSDSIVNTLPIANSLLSSLSNEQASAVINTAYHTLNHPDTRATHLLELVEQAESLNDSIRDLDFLDQAMDLRISLEEADINELPRLKTQLQNWIGEVEQVFNTAYESRNWVTANLATQQLKFLIKLQNYVARKTDELANHNQHNDDDLYV